MKTNRSITNRITRFVLSLAVIIIYLFGLIRGTIALVLFLVAAAIVTYFLAAAVFKWMTMD